MIIKDLGAVTAYAAAVEKGYTGTEEEFATLMASYASVAKEAAESAESASASATNASASAQTATTKASEASTAAQTATAKAEETQADADAAALDASQALSAASTATTKASEAAQSASDAVTAKTAAQTAQTAAEGSATTAQTAAQTATTKAAEAAESARTLTIDTTLTQSGQAADAKKTGDEITGLKSGIDTLQEKVEKNAEFIDAVKVLKQYGNIYKIATDEIDNKYYYRSNGNLAQGSNASYMAFIVKVIPNTKYTFIKADIVLLDADKKPLTGSKSWDYRGVTTCNSGNAEYMAVDVAKTDIPASGYVISQGTALDDGDYSLGIYTKSIPLNIKSPVAEISGDIPANGTLTLLGRTAIKDGQNIIFKSDISSFNEIILNFSGGQSVNYIKVDVTNMTVRASSADAVVYPHGLTIANELILLVELIDGTAVISLTSGGVTFKQTVTWNQSGGTITESQIVSNGTVCTGAKLSNVYSAVSRKIWYFGDSYAQFNTDTRIPYYLHQYGFDKNVLISAVSGGTSSGSRIAFETLLAYGKPDFAVLATGINNGSDSADAPQAAWLSNVQTFITDCMENDVVPILCTLPTIPSVNNEKKNEWVKASGYRYVDYAKAVGADASGQWYTGMLSNDNIHPSTLGGNALFTQLIADLPEITAFY